MSERLWLTLILLATALIGWSYAVANPVFEGGDELWHYPMVQHLSEGNPLPVQVFDPAEAGPWKQQASQPPLYYYFGAWLTGWIDSSDMSEIRWQNPHVNNGIIASDGNINLTIHNPDWNPFWGTLLAVRLIRFVSVLMGVVTIYFTYRIGKYAAPQRSEVALGAAAIVAFLPMRLFVSAAVNNDNGIIMLATIAVFLLVRFVALADAEQATSAVYRQVTLIGITIGLACLTKIIGVGLLPLAFGALFLGNWKASARELEFVRRIGAVFGRALLQTALVALITFAIAGWWYIRNVQLYDDWRGWSAFIAVLGQRSQPASLAQLWDERFGFMMAYWGLFGGVNVPLPIGIYHLLNAVTVLGVFGFLGYLLQQLVQYSQKQSITDNEQQVTNSKAVAIRILTHVLDFAVRHATIVICFVWMVAVVAGLIAWATTTWSSQGRLVFGALQAEVVLLTLGLIGWMEGRVVKFGRILITTVATFLFLVAAATPFLIIQPAYAIETSDATTTTPLTTFGDSIALLATLPDYPKAIAAGDEFEICLDWLILKEIERNWSVFVHLNDPILNNPISQRDMYLAQGLLGTSFAKPGTTIHNCYLLQVDPTAIGPVDLTLDVGLYDFTTFERLSTETGAGHLTLDTIMLQSIPTDERRAPRANFGDEIKLVDFEISSRRVERNDTLNLTLHLSALTELNADYSVTAQIVSEALEDTTRWAASDLELVSSDWQPDTLQSIQLQLPINPETPAGVYRLILGVYTQTNEGFRNLSLISADGRITNDNLLTLTKLRIDE